MRKKKERKKDIGEEIKKRAKLKGIRNKE